MRDLEGVFEAENLAREATAAGVPSTRLTRAAELGLGAMNMAGSAVAGIGSAALGAAGSAASSAGTLVKQYGPGLARAAGESLVGNIKAIPGVLDTTIDFLETTAGIINTAVRGTTDSVSVGGYAIVFSPQREMSRRTDF